MGGGSLENNYKIRGFSGGPAEAELNQDALPFFWGQISSSKTKMEIFRWLLQIISQTSPLASSVERINNRTPIMKRSAELL